jgi:ABC-type glycerol-3-phosphate transport system substrate-binding protein
MRILSAFVLTFIALTGLVLSACHPSSSVTATTSNTQTATATALTAQAPLNNVISLDLGSPAKATVYQGNKVIFQQSYAKPGNYSIDTSSYPNGEYRLVVQTSGTTAQYVLHQTLMFSKPGNINAKVSLR